MNLRALEWLKTPGRAPYSSSVVVLTAAYLGIGVAAFVAWRITSDDAWVESFFRIPGALLSLFLASMQLCFSLRVLRHFLPHEAMYRVWLCIAGSAAFDLAGTPVRVAFRGEENPYAGKRNPLTPRQVRKRKRLIQRNKR